MNVEDISQLATQISKTNPEKITGAGTGKTGSRLQCPPRRHPIPPKNRGKGQNIGTSRQLWTESGLPARRRHRRFSYLKELENSGEISDLRLQVNFTLQEGYTKTDGERVRPIVYKADFTYKKRDENGRYTLYIVEDVKTKGTRTEKYKIKRKLFMEKFQMGNFGSVKYIQFAGAFSEKNRQGKITEGNL